MTINRFFGVHVWLMPALLALFVALHLFIFRHNGSAGPPTDRDLKRLPQGRFWPNQMFMDGFASFVVFVLIVLLSIFSPAPLDAKANPTTPFIPFPAWYFLGLYGLLRVAGWAPENIVPFTNLLATVVLPGLAVTVLVLLPFLDRNPSRRLSKRPWITAITALSVLGAVGLSVFSQVEIQKEQTGMGAAPVAAATAPPGAGKGATVFANSCSGCHGANGQGQPGAFPPLAKNASVTGSATEVIHTVLYGRSGPLTVNGANFNGTMPAWKGQLSNADVAAVITYIRSSWGNSAAAVTEADVAKVHK